MVSGGETNNAMRWSLCDIGDDSLSTVLSFLSPYDIVACASVCKYLRAFCKEDRKVWLPMCERSWGLQTCVEKWGRRKVSFKVLHSILTKLENLVGFWRGVGHGGHGSLVVFEWGEYCVSGFRVIPSRRGSYDICKIPFVWIGVSETGRPVCFFDPMKPFAGEGCSPASDCANCSPCCPCPVKRSSARENPFTELGPDADIEQQAPPAGLVVVDLHFVGKFHIVMEELQQPHFVVNCSLAEAAAVASFGSSGSFAGATSPEAETCCHSPPGSFQYEMYQFLASKVTSQGGDRASRKQRRKYKERALSQGRRSCEPEHFVKVRDVGPTPARPLQGLWKGICDSMCLDFLLVLYDDHGGIVCRRVGEPLASTHSGSVCWNARSNSTIRAPLSDLEQYRFNEREHILPKFCCDVTGQQEMTGKPYDELGEEVLAVLCTNPIAGLGFGAMSDVRNTVGRVWQYASGRFGLGFLPTKYIIDFRPICSPTGLLMDALDNC